MVFIKFVNRTHLCIQRLIGKIHLELVFHENRAFFFYLKVFLIEYFYTRIFLKVFAKYDLNKYFILNA